MSAEEAVWVSVALVGPVRADASVSVNGKQYVAAPSDDAPVAFRGTEEESTDQYLVTIWPDLIEITSRDGDNDTWAIPLRITREEQ